MSLEYWLKEKLSHIASQGTKYTKTKKGDREI